MHSCSICIENPCNFRTECNHSFCKNCATEWLLTHNTCPMCRKEFYTISQEELDEIEFINYHNEMYSSPIVNIHPLYTEIIDVLFLDSDTVYYRKTLIFNIYYNTYIEPKLPKNINMRYKKEKYRFDNTNFNNLDTRY